MDKSPVKIDQDEVKIAKSLIGQKVVLLGGGQFVNHCYIGKLNAVHENGQADITLLGWSHPGDKEETFTPWISSWYVRPLAEKYQHLPLGEYDMWAGVRLSPKEPQITIPTEKPEKPKHKSSKKRLPRVGKHSATLRGLRR